jgi:uncharacterized membrane protein YgcG
MDNAEHLALKKFARQNRLAMTQVVRQGVKIRLSDNDYTKGFNAGVQACINTVQGMQVAQMKFPSGQSFSELIADELSNNIIKVPT